MKIIFKVIHECRCLWYATATFPVYLVGLLLVIWDDRGVEVVTLGVRHLGARVSLTHVRKLSYVFLIVTPESFEHVQACNSARVFWLSRWRGQGSSGLLWS